MVNILELNNVTYKYDKGNRNVLENINYTFEKGKLYTIMGKSGSGKTTLLSLISGLDLATGGSVLYNNKSLKSIDRDEYRSKEIGVIFQGYNLLTNATVLENIILSMNISQSKVNNKSEYAKKLLATVGIDEEKAQRKILNLSGGEQQRVGIARALSHQPNIIIADEPTGNLDSNTQKSIMGIFKDLAHKHNKCVIIVTHSDQVAEYADSKIQLNSINKRR